MRVHICSNRGVGEKTEFRAGPLDSCGAVSLLSLLSLPSLLGMPLSIRMEFVSQSPIP